MATSKFERLFTDNNKNPLLGATIELIPQANTYPTGKITLNEHPTRRGWYYKDGVAMDEYKIYVNGSLYTQHIFHADIVLKYLREKFNEYLLLVGDSIAAGTIRLSNLHAEIRSLLGESIASIHSMNLYEGGVLDISSIPAEVLYIVVPTGPLTITSISGGEDGRVLTIRTSLNSYDLTLSASGNMQFAVATNRVLSQKQAITLMYSSDTGRWLEISNTFDQEVNFTDIFNLLIDDAEISKEQITGLTANRAAIINADGELDSHPSTTITDLTRIAGLTSNAQNQITALDKIRSGVASFTGTANSRIVSTGMTTDGYRFFAIPVTDTFNADDSLRVEVNPDTTITVRRGNSGTSGLSFFWVRIKPE